MRPQDWLLIALALAGVGLLVLLVTWARLNAFLALLAAALLVGVGAGQPMLEVAKAFQDGLGSTLGGVAAVICLGTMLGKLLAESHGAEVLAREFARFFGPAHIGWCIMALALTIGLTTWFAVGLILLAPILHTLTRETGRPFLHLALPMLACLSVMHGLMPPHPGPIMAINALHANRGLVLLWGFGLGLPVAILAGAVRGPAHRPQVGHGCTRPASPRHPFAAVRTNAFLDAAAGGFDADRDACRFDDGRGQIAAGGGFRWQSDGRVIHCSAFCPLVAGHSLRLPRPSIVKIHRGFRVRGRHDGADCRRWRRICARPANQRFGRCHGRHGFRGASLSRALRLAGVGIHPSGDGFGDGFHHSGLGLDGAGARCASGCQ